MNYMYNIEVFWKQYNDIDVLLHLDLLTNIDEVLYFSSALLFIKTFFKTMQREWHGIDRLRLDKFYLVSHYKQ